MAEPVKAIPFSGGLEIGSAPHRCAGQLTPAALGAVTKFERFLVQGGDIVRATIKLSAVAGTATLAIYGLLSDANGNDDTTGTRNTIDGQTSASLTTAQLSVSYTVTGERYVDVELVSGTTCTVTYVDVSLKP